MTTVAKELSSPGIVALLGDTVELLGGPPSRGIIIRDVPLRILRVGGWQRCGDAEIRSCQVENGRIQRGLIFNALIYS